MENIQLEFFKSNELEKNLKASIHKTGKIGFTMDAAKKLNLSKEKSISIARNQSNIEDKSLYIKVNDTKIDGAFNINKAGSYFYVNTKALFDNLKIDYVSNYISFDISQETIGGQTIFVFKWKEKVRDNDSDTNEDD